VFFAVFGRVDGGADGGVEALGDGGEFCPSIWLLEGREGKEGCLLSGAAGYDSHGGVLGTAGSAVGDAVEGHAAEILGGYWGEEGEGGECEY